MSDPGPAFEGSVPRCQPLPGDAEPDARATPSRVGDCLVLTPALRVAGPDDAAKENATVMKQAAARGTVGDVVSGTGQAEPVTGVGNCFVLTPALRVADPDDAAKENGTAMKQAAARGTTGEVAAKQEPATASGTGQAEPVTGVLPDRDVLHQMVAGMVHKELQGAPVTASIRRMIRQEMQRVMTARHGDD